MRGRGPDRGALFLFRATEHLRRQVVEMQKVWPSLSSRVTGQRLVVEGAVQPTELTGAYRVRIVYDYGKPPEVFVVEPELRRRSDGEAIPHIYYGPQPCLYLPKAREWTGRELVAETIIPWLMLWITYYELWHATGEWQGGGEHPEPAGASNQSPQETSVVGGALSGTVEPQEDA